jgi:hypothetical protein
MDKSNASVNGASKLLELVAHIRTQMEGQVDGTRVNVAIWGILEIFKIRPYNSGLGFFLYICYGITLNH